MAISKSIKILIAEDDLVTRSELKDDLEDLGFNGEIIEADNGKEAFDLFVDHLGSESPIDFIISDYMMPVCSGYDFLLNIRKEAKFENIPFLMLTSKNDREIVLRCAKAKVSNYLIKPWNTQVLSERMHSCWIKHFPDS